ncbi:MAG: hypothetical protein HC781_19930 [Leptolyngbyaceae cyanobacterium CSU_1_4]|nr:hypothetical protein [Leptolyngbyaceae cyanobacterium CSU_1_4]
MIEQSPIETSEQTGVISPMREAPQELRIEVLASGLDSPRGLTFGSDGALYVTEAGRGGPGASIPSPSIPVQFILWSNGCHYSDSEW